jgi:hypothetical protein
VTFIHAENLREQAARSFKAAEERIIAVLADRNMRAVAN